MKLYNRQSWEYWEYSEERGTQVPHMPEGKTSKENRE